jgi:hypothetical protein
MSSPDLTRNQRRRMRQQALAAIHAIADQDLP